MESFSKYWQFIVGVIGTSVVAIGGWLYTQGQQSKEYEGRTFDTVEQKVETVTIIKDIPSPLETERRRIFDSLETVKTNNMLEKLLNDSKSIKKHIHHLDSVNVLTSDQVYQMKEQIKKNHN